MSRVASGMQLATIFDGAPTPIAVVSQPHHLLEFANDACRRWLGDSKPIGRRIEELVPEAEWVELAHIIDETADLGDVRIARRMGLATTGATRPFDVVCVPLADPHPPRRVLMYTIAVADDPGPMGGREGPTEARDAEQERFGTLTVLSHEMRTPLSAIGGYLGLLLHGASALDEPQMAYLRGIERSHRHLTNLVDAMLTRARMGAGKVDYRVEATTLTEVLDEVDALTEPQRLTKRLRFERTEAHRDLVVQCDREKVVQILLNLISNSVKFTRVGGLITISTERPAADVAAVVVADSGVGMTSDQVRSVFEPFTQFEASERSDDRGLGLGMAISREYARAMGGDLTVSSEPGRGTSFRLWLPIHGEPRGTGLRRLEAGGALSS